MMWRQATGRSLRKQQHQSDISNPASKTCVEVAAFRFEVEYSDPQTSLAHAGGCLCRLGRPRCRSGEGSSGRALKPQRADTLHKGTPGRLCDDGSASVCGAVVALWGMSAGSAMHQQQRQMNLVVLQSMWPLLLRAQVLSLLGL